VTWYGRQNLSARNGVRTGAATCINRHGIDQLSVNFCLEAAKTDVRRFMIATTCRAAGPMNRERIDASSHFCVESLGKSDRAALGFDQSEIAIIGADAGNQSAHEGRWSRRELLEQSFPEKHGHAIGGNVWNDRILSGSQANLAIAIGVRQARESVQL